MEAALAERVDRQIAVQSAAPPERARPNFTGRIAASFGVGLPVTLVAAGLGGHYGAGAGAVLGTVAVLAALVGLNVYYTEVERDLEKERLRARHRP
jgi:hypothetical protein